MNKDQLLEHLGTKSPTTSRTLHKITSTHGVPERALSFAWLESIGKGEYELCPVKDAETQDAITEALEEGVIVISGERNYDFAKGTEGEKLVLSAP